VRDLIYILFVTWKNLNLCFFFFAPSSSSLFSSFFGGYRSLIFLLSVEILLISLCDLSYSSDETGKNVESILVFFCNVSFVFAIFIILIISITFIILLTSITFIILITSITFIILITFIIFITLIIIFITITTFRV